MYPAEIVIPMKEELTENGFTELLSANSGTPPDFLTTSFAGFDIDAVKAVREHLLPYPPSSPAIALFKNGQLVHYIERHMIEGRSAQAIAENLIASFQQHCN
ncbi:MAG: BrxA/BrxB family bacilliredoxin [Terrimonas sp.]|nr:BrxA/BrxB family bacilliredoxin [Terrimonas sp.]